MIMTNEEILREYRQAKQPMKQIGILADENACAKREIVEILLEAGETVPMQFLTKGNGLIGGKKSEPESAEDEREALPPVLPAPRLAGFSERVNDGAIEVIARMVADSDSGSDQENEVWRFRERVRGVLAMVHELRGGYGE